MRIDQEFRDLLPSLSAMELETLEASIEAEGQRDPIIVWANNDDTIIDGHNRFAICEKLGIKPKTKALSFTDRTEVMKWIYMNQQARRNMTPAALALLRGRVYNAMKQSHGSAPGEARKVPSGQHAHLKTSEQVAKEFGVDEKTVRRNGQFAAVYDKASPEKKKEMLTSKAEKRKQAAKERDKNGSSDGGWSKALLKASTKEHVSAENIAKLRGVSNLPDQRKGLSVLAQGTGFVVEHLGPNKYRVRRAVILPVDQVPDEDSKLLSVIKKEMAELLSYLNDRNYASFSHSMCQKFVKRIVDSLKHIR